MSYKITEVEGIGPAYAAKLEEQGIKTTDDYLKAAADKKGRTALAEATGISEKLVLRWANQADLMRISGVGEEFAELLEAAGVDSVPELAQRRADNLTAKMKEVNEDKKLARRAPAESEVDKWVAQAKEMDRVITH
ncbi:MAG: DUF4332 domain-containing protein [Pseudomonadota bacterium]